MAKRILGFFKNLRKPSEPNLNGESPSVKTELLAKITDLKSKIPSVKDGIDAIKTVPQRMPEVNVQNKVRDVITKYEKFTGVDEIMQLQRTVVEAQDKFIAAQDRRREAANKLMSIQWKLKDIHDEMQSIPKGDEKYLRLVTEEHKIINEEQHLRKEFGAIEREEREHFGSMSSAVKLSHERERAHADRNKYWYIVASLVGTAFGVLGSTMNNRIKMSEFRDMLTEQMERSNSVLMTVGSPSHSIRAAEGKPQQLKEMESRIAALAANQGTILGHIYRTEKSLELHFGEVKRLIQASQASSAKSDKALQKAITASMTTHGLDMAALENSHRDWQTWISDREEVIKLSMFVGFVALLMVGIISKMS